jgi:hypothetical protein
MLGLYSFVVSLGRRWRSSSFQSGIIRRSSARCLHVSRVQLQLTSADVLCCLQVLNEASSIVATLEQLRQLQPAAAELIVVDGGSTDG